MARSVLLLAAVQYFVAIVLCATLNIRISPSTLLANPNTLPPSTHAILTSGSGSGSTVKSLIRKDNSIILSDIQTTGSHLLKIFTRDYVFASYRIDISRIEETVVISGAWETFVGSPWTDTGVPLVPATANGQTAPVPSLTIHPKVLARKQFYEDRPGFSPLTLLKNPMILMGVVALAFTFGMPKLMENMDPEMKAEYEEIQKTGPMSGITRAMQGQSPSGSGEGFDLAGYLAGQSTAGGKATGRDAGDIRERRR